MEEGCRKCSLFISVATVVLFVLIIVVVQLKPRDGLDPLKSTSFLSCELLKRVSSVQQDHQTNKTHLFRACFMEKCENFNGGNKRNDCQNIFAVFEQAYKGKSKCNIPMEAYYPVLNMVPFNHPCDKTIFWSKIKDLVLNYTENKDCFTLDKTLLGFVLNDLTWCGKEGSNETFTINCPGWDGCKNNPVNSFWDAASAKFAEYTCGVVTAVLDGSREKPFDPTSTLARIEMKNLKERKVQRLDVILVPVTKHIIRSNCASQNLKDLRKQLDPKIDFTCKEQTQLQIDTCISKQIYGLWTVLFLCSLAILCYYCIDRCRCCI